MNSALRKLLGDPLTHFLLGGLALFGVYHGVAERGSSEDALAVIVVNRAVLLDFLQSRAGPAFGAAQLDALSEPERARLVADYVREEALHREAIALGLERDDTVIRRRLVQKLEFVAQGFADASLELADAELQRFLDSHRVDYAVPALATFTHVFFDGERRGADAARREAERAVERLNAASVGFDDAARHGDRFPYHVNYVDRPPDLVADHFGPETASAFFALAPEARRWQGPFESRLGWHAVLLTRRSERRAPGLEEVRARVEEDARRERVRERSEAALGEIVARYEVRIEGLP